MKFSSKTNTITNLVYNRKKFYTVNYKTKNIEVKYFTSASINLMNKTQKHLTNMPKHSIL